MIAPTFEPEATPGAGSEAFARGMTQGQSWMERSQQMRLQQEEEQLRQQEIVKNTILKPVVEATAAADLATMAGKLTSAQLVQQHRQQAATAAPQALADFIAITKNPDVDERARQLDAHAASISWLDDVPEYKPLVAAVNDARGKAHLESIANGKIEQMKEATKARADTAEAQIEQRAKQAELAAANRIELKAKDEEIARLKAASSEKVANIGGKSRVEAATVGALTKPANQAAITANEGTLQAGQSAAQQLIGTNQALELLNDPELRTGTGAAFALKAKRLGGLFGIDTGDAQNIEQLQSLMGNALLERAKQIKGRLTNTEVGMLNTMSPDIAKTPEGNRALLSVMKNVAERQVNVAKIVNQGRADGLSEREIQLEVNDFLLNQTGQPEKPAAGASGSNVIKSVTKIQ